MYNFRSSGARRSPLTRRCLPPFTDERDSRTISDDPTPFAQSRVRIIIVVYCRRRCFFFRQTVETAVKHNIAEHFIHKLHTYIWV